MQWPANISKITLLVVNGDESLRGENGRDVARRSSTLSTIYCHVTSLTIPLILRLQPIIRCLCVCGCVCGGRGGVDGGGGVAEGKGEEGTPRRERQGADDPSSQKASARVTGARRSLFTV